MLFLDRLKERFPQSSFEILKEETAFNIILFDLEFRGKKYKVFSTDGLYQYKMNVSPKYVGKEHIELCVCVEDDWNINDKEQQWPIEKLAWLGNYMLEKQTWFGAGHTIPNGNPPQSISLNVTQNHFFFDEATWMHDIFNSFYLTDDIVINYLFLIPITEDELAFKHKKSTFNFKRKLADRQISEVVEEYRPNFAMKRWRFW